MGLFDWFKRSSPRVYTDPTFGVLRYEHASWSGRVVFPPVGEEVAVILESDGSEPSPLYRGLFEELIRRYPTLRPVIDAALFELWRPHLEDWRGDRPPRATSADTLIALTRLDSIILELPTRVRLGYGFVEEGDWDDATFTIELSDWRVSDAYLSD